MKRFSIMDAAAEPFRLVGRRPLATIVWGLVMMAPTLMVIGAMIPFFSELAASGAFSPEALAADDPEDLPFGDDMAAVMQFQIWSNLAQLLGFVTLVLVTTAIIRAVQAGRKGDGAFFLRIGMAELQVAVVGLAVGIGAFFVALIAILLAAGLGLAAWQLGQPWGWLICLALGIVVFVGLLLLWGRLSLLAPASVHYRTFAFEEGWKLGRGKTWRLLGLWIILVLIAIMVGIAVMILFLIVMLAVGGGMQSADPEAIEAWFENLAQQPALLIGMGVVLLIPMAWIQGFSQALFTAPYARVVQVLAAPDPATAVAAETPPEAVEELH
jgi:MFS family permease